MAIYYQQTYISCFKRWTIWSFRVWAV